VVAAMVTVAASVSMVMASAAPSKMVAVVRAEPRAAPIGPAPAPRTGETQSQSQGRERCPSLHGNHIVQGGNKQEFYHIPHSVFRMPGRQMMECAAVVHDPFRQHMKFFRTHATDVCMCHVGLFYVGHNPLMKLRMPVQLTCLNVMVMPTGVMMTCVGVVVPTGMMMTRMGVVVVMPTGVVMARTGVMVVPAGVMMTRMGMMMPTGMMVMMLVHMYKGTPFLWDAPLYGVPLEKVRNSCIMKGSE